MKKMVLVSLFLAGAVIILGAYTRLTDAGLGCPDWPGCYGFLSVPTETHHVAAANEAFPDRPVEAHKAWNEMIHRYFASTLGLLIVAICLIALFKGEHKKPKGLPVLLVGLVIFQGLLGMWTVTLNLLPVVVMGHLLGGFTVLSCLLLLFLRLKKPSLTSPVNKRLTMIAAGGIVVLVIQIALGGWTSANYAALACTELPVCEGEWHARMDIKGAYSVPAADNYEYGAHDYDERMTMHIFHRVGAVVTFLYLAMLAWLLKRQRTQPILRRAAWLLLGTLCLQVLLGISNVVFSLPLPVAVAHNAVGACLLLIMVWITYTLSRSSGGRYV